VEQLLTIGEFAQQSGLSRSALRFYDQNGLLRPSFVDEETGYRYYAVAQVELALLVRRLRAAEMPVALAQDYIASSVGHRAEMLDAHASSFRSRARRVQDAVDELRAAVDTQQPATDERWCSLAPAEFAAALDQVGFAIADPTERSELAVVWVETREQSLRLVTTDSFRLVVRDMVPKSVSDEGIRGVIELEHLRMLTAELSVARSLTLSQDSSGVLAASIDGRTVAIGGTGEGFPDYESLLSALPPGAQAVVARVDLEQALRNLPPAGRSIGLRFGCNGVSLECADTAEMLGGSWPGPDLAVWMDRQFMIDAVRATIGPDVAIEAVSALEPITFRSADTGTFSVLTMPVRPPEPEPLDC
jgi:DNA polymerase-3 subunit beta